MHFIDKIREQMAILLMSKLYCFNLLMLFYFKWKCRIARFHNMSIMTKLEKYNACKYLDVYSWCVYAGPYVKPAAGILTLQHQISGRYSGHKNVLNNQCLDSFAWRGRIMACGDIFHKQFCSGILKWYYDSRIQPARTCEFAFIMTSSQTVLEHGLEICLISNLSRPLIHP